MNIKLITAGVLAMTSFAASAQVTLYGGGAAGYTDYVTNYVAANGVTGTNALCMGPWPQSTDSGSTTMQGRSASVASIAAGLGMHGMDTWELLSDIWTNPARRCALTVRWMR